MSESRRTFIKKAGSTALGAVILSQAFQRVDAFPLGLPPGLQLWSVKDALAADEDATLGQIAKIGYRELEIYELPKSPSSFKKKCTDLGMTLVGGHFYLHSLKSQHAIDVSRELGLRYMIAIFPTLRSLGDADISKMSDAQLNPLYEKITLDDYKWNAEQFNRFGEILKRQGLQFGYHNHAVDLKRFGGAVGFDTLIESTDPNLVVFEMDCGHVIHAGADPIAYLRKFPTRIQLLHLKDLKRGYGISSSFDAEHKDTNAEIGAGVIDWRNLFRVAKQGDVKHCFVEHEGAMDRPPLQAIARSYDYLQRIGV